MEDSLNIGGSSEVRSNSTLADTFKKWIIINYWASLVLLILMSIFYGDIGIGVFLANVGVGVSDNEHNKIDYITSIDFTIPLKLPYSKTSEGLVYTNE